MLRPMTSQSAENKRLSVLPEVGHLYPPITTRPREHGRRGEDCQSWRTGSRALTGPGIAIIGSHGSDGVHKSEPVKVPAEVTNVLSRPHRLLTHDHQLTAAGEGMLLFSGHAATATFSMLQRTDLHPCTHGWTNQTQWVIKRDRTQIMGRDMLETTWGVCWKTKRGGYDHVL